MGDGASLDLDNLNARNLRQTLRSLSYKDTMTKTTSTRPKKEPLVGGIVKELQIHRAQFRKGFATIARKKNQSRNTPVREYIEMLEQKGIAKPVMEDVLI